MKTIFNLIAAITFATLSTASLAGTTCKTDWQGRLVCTDDSGYSTTQRKDFMGNTRIEDNRGNSVTCRNTWNNQVRCD